MEIETGVFIFEMIIVIGLIAQVVINSKQD
jgi:hypothetical protein